MLEVYFACSIRGGREADDIYPTIVACIKKRAVVLSEVFADQTLTRNGMDAPSSEIYQKDIAWVKRSDALIAEVTTPSLGVGYEIAKAEEWGKPVLALYRVSSDRKLSAMIEGSPDTRAVLYNTVDEVVSAIDAFLDNLADR